METRTKILVTHDWMLDLELSDKEEKLLALIYGYSQDGSSRMRATAESIAKWLRCSTRHAQRLTLKLERMGLIAHEVVYDRRHGCNVTEFWVRLGDEKPEKSKINWSGKGRPVYDPYVVNQYDTNVVNDYDPYVVNHNRVSRYSSNSNNKNCGGNNSARSRAKTTTTTGDLFKNDDNGLTPELPYKESYFVEAWAVLLRQPSWQNKTPDALRLVLDDLAAVADPVIATYCCELAVKRGWDSINDPQQIYEKDEAKVLEFADKLRTRQEEGEK